MYSTISVVLTPRGVFRVAERLCDLQIGPAGKSAHAHELHSQIFFLHSLGMQSMMELTAAKSQPYTLSTANVALGLRASLPIDKVGALR